MKLYVGNLPFTATEDQIRDLFAGYGTPESVRLITDRETGRAKGFGFVEFANDDEARNAMSALNGQDFGGRALTVNEARPMENRTGGASRGGYSRSRY
jgi:RNA recognition motif-containing protein